MNAIFHPSVLSGQTLAIPSKSDAHRILICAALADRETVMICRETNRDIDATVACLNQLGAGIQKRSDRFIVSPIGICRKEASLPCGESGSTLRFLLPVTLALGANASFMREGRLSQRPLSPMKEELIRAGTVISDTEPLRTHGTLKPGSYCINGGISSQFISGLLMALSVIEGDSTLTVTGEIQSKGYIEMTLRSLKQFGAQISSTPDLQQFRITGRKHLHSPGTVPVEGDWSNSAVWLAAGALGTKPVSVKGLASDTCQGDSSILEILNRFGASFTWTEDTVTVFPAPLSGITVDVRQIPDLAPVIAAVGACAKGTTILTGVQRLRAKESDRISAICQTLQALGADIRGDDQQIVISGKSVLDGGFVPSWNDHRIVMCAALASLRCTHAVQVEQAQSISKSYPHFFRDFSALGGQITIQEEA